MKKIIHSILAIFSTILCFGQLDKKTIDLNLGFQQSNASGTLPKDWVQWGSVFAEPTSFVKFSNGSISTPGHFTISKELKVGKTNPGYFQGKVAILIIETTQSSAEYHTTAFRTAPRAVVIGSTTAGADGDVARFFLPGSVFTMISGIGVYYPDGTETQRVGIIPDIEVKPTIKGIREGRDELLEKAIQLID